MLRHPRCLVLLLVLAAVSSAAAAALPGGLYTIRLDAGRDACADRKGYLSALPPAASRAIMLARVVAPNGLQLWRLGAGGADITGRPIVVQVWAQAGRQDGFTTLSRRPALAAG